MDRRALLASVATGSGAVFAGCLDDASDGTEDGTPDDGDGNASSETETDGTDDGTEADGNDSLTEASGTDENDGNDENDGTDGTDGTDGSGDEANVPEPDGTCGSDADPLSSVLLDGVDQNAGACHEDLTPSFVVANERDDAVAATVEIASDGESTFEGSYSLEASERATEQDVGTAADLESVTVSLEGDESLSGEWPGVACYRHAVVLTKEGLETGYVGPLAGPGDTQHDCYAGDPAPIVLRSETDRTATVTIVDHCRESVDGETVDLEAGGTERLEGALTNGGRYDVVVEVDGGDADTAEFYDACWGLSVSIDEEGDPVITPVEID